MNTLTLIVKKEWFDLIKSGKKKEEYREIKPYWQKRLIGREFDTIYFCNGYSDDAPWCQMKCRGISMKELTEFDKCPQEWIGRKVFVIMLGEILSTSEEETITITIHR